MLSLNVSPFPATALHFTSLPFHKHLFSSKVCLLSAYTDLLSGNCAETSRYCLFFFLTKYLFWREKTTKFKWCCITQKGNNPPPKFRLYTVRESPTTSRVDASIYFWFSSFSKFRNPICSREKSAVLLVNMYHCSEMQNKAGCYMSLNNLMHRHTVNSNSCSMQILIHEQHRFGSDPQPSSHQTLQALLLG